MKEIASTQGKVALVDDADFEWLNQYKWRAHEMNGFWYADSGMKTLRMHRLIMGLQRGNKLQVDHINGNGLDNRRANLRVCTQGQNLSNNSKYKNGATSCFKGVSWNKERKVYKAMIGINGKRIYLGYFDNERDAALAYNKAAQKYFGDFAKPNNLRAVG